MKIEQILESLIVAAQDGSENAVQITKGIIIRKEVVDALITPVVVLATWYGMSIPRKEMYSIDCRVTVQNELYVQVTYFPQR